MTIYHLESFLLDQVKGVHNFELDTIKLALFSGVISASTEAYSTLGEVASGDGYTAGGLTLTLTSSYPKIEMGSGAVRYEPAVWTFTAPKTIRSALMYNASKSGKAILMIDFGRPRTCIETFRVRFPLAAGPVIRLSTRLAA